MYLEEGRPVNELRDLREREVVEELGITVDALAWDGTRHRGREVEVDHIPGKMWQTKTEACSRDVKYSEKTEWVFPGGCEITLGTNSDVKGDLLL
jgi:hypothetical protein